MVLQELFFLAKKNMQYMASQNRPCQNKRIGGNWYGYRDRKVHYIFCVCKSKILLKKKQNNYKKLIIDIRTMADAHNLILAISAVPTVC